MGLRVVLTIHKQEDPVFSDLALMNKILMKQGMGELYADMEEGNDDAYLDDFEDQGPFMFEYGVDLLIASMSEGKYFEGYEKSTDIWGCFGEREMRTIARFLIGGKIVFHIDTEGWPDQYWVITPGNVEKKELTF